MVASNSICWLIEHQSQEWILYLQICFFWQHHHQYNARSIYIDPSALLLAQSVYILYRGMYVLRLIHLQRVMVGVVGCITEKFTMNNNTRSWCCQSNTMLTSQREDCTSRSFIYTDLIIVGWYCLECWLLLTTLASSIKSYRSRTIVSSSCDSTVFCWRNHNGKEYVFVCCGTEYR